MAAEIVCLTVEDPNNYDAVKFLESLKVNELARANHQVSIISGNHPKPTNFPGLVDSIPRADLLIVFVRRATPPAEQIELIQQHLAAAKPLVGIRTANHAFEAMARDQIPSDCVEWPEFVPEVLGCANTGYETKGMPYKIAPHPKASATHEILQGIDFANLVGHTSLYRVFPVVDDAQLLLIGTPQSPFPSQPIAWTRCLPKTGSRMFYTSLGDPKDVQQTGVRTLIVNGITWALKRES